MRFFKNIELIKAIIEEQKEYLEKCEISFLGQDYTQKMSIEPVDLIISQFAGFVGQATKHHLKVGGILLCNDSHGDATLSRFDDDFELIGVMDQNNTFSDSDLNKYFLRSSGEPVDLTAVYEKMKGPKYSLTAENYLFRKVK